MNEANRIKKQKDYEKKLNAMNSKREKLEEYEKMINEQKEKFRKTRINLTASRNEDEAIRLNILEYQRAFVFRGLDRDQVTNLKRVNARENIVISQLELNRKLNQFNKDINKLKDESILKKSPEQRKQMYKELLRAEAERKRKEEEDKMLNSK